MCIQLQSKESPIIIIIIVIIIISRCPPLYSTVQVFDLFFSLLLTVQDKIVKYFVSVVTFQSPCHPYFVVGTASK